MSSFWQEVLARPRDVYARLSRGQRMGVLALASVGIVVAVLASMLAGRENFTMLYGSLEPEDAQEICAKLTELGVPYRLSPDGSMVKVPEERVPEVRMQLAGAGVLKIGSRGFELFDENQLGITDDLFNVTMQRALQGEIEKSLKCLAPVKKALVLVSLPKSFGFTRDAARPSANVTLELRPGVQLSDSEVASIAALVRASVGRSMKLEDVSIVDHEARKLHPTGDPNDPMSSTAYLQKVQALERQKEEKAESQLRDAFGPNKATVRVNLELDLNYKETAREVVDAANKVPVKEITSTESTGGTSSGGDTSLASGAKTTKESVEGVVHEDKETEYREGIDRNLTITPAGAITRMSVSLLLDESDETLKAKQKDIEEIVKSAVGFQKERASGLKDEIRVALVPFAKPPAAAELPGTFALENLLPLLGHVAEGVIVLFVLILLAKTLRGGASVQALSRRKVGKGGVVVGAAAGVAASAVDPEQEEDAFAELQFAEEKGPDLRAKLGRFVNKHPEQAREVLVAWLKEEAAV